MYRIGDDVSDSRTQCVVIDECGRRTVTEATTTTGAPQEGVLYALAVAAEHLQLRRADLLSATDLFVHALVAVPVAVGHGERPATDTATEDAEVVTYLTKLERRLGECGLPVSVHVIQARGGLTSVIEASQHGP